MMQWVGNRLGPAGRPVGRVTFYRREVAEAVRVAVGGGGGRSRQCYRCRQGPGCGMGYH
jgi:hypothetical protein